MRSHALWLLVCAPLLLPVSAVHAGGSLDLGSGGKGLSLGNSSVWTGVRINLRDDGLESIRGLNLTFWRPEENPDGEISGLSLGLWGPRADHLSGLQLGLVGAQANRSLRGIGIGLIGLGVGGDHGGWQEDSVADSKALGLFVGGVGVGVSGDMKGISVGGVGLGVGRHAHGIFVGGLGMGVGGDLSGVAIGGLGMGVGGSMSGISVGGLGTGVGGDAKGLMISGVGQGVGGDFQGINLAGIGGATGEDFTGLGIGGIGLGVGGHLKGIVIGGVGVSADRTSALTAALATTRGRQMSGVTISAYNRWHESMSGLAIGVVNITDRLNGVQLGLLNIVHDNPSGRRILPLINWGG